MTIISPLELSVSNQAALSVSRINGRSALIYYGTHYTTAKEVSHLDRPTNCLAYIFCRCFFFIFIYWWSILGPQILGNYWTDLHQVFRVGRAV